MIFKPEIFLMVYLQKIVCFIKAHPYKLGCGTVRVELKLRFTGYRLRFTVSMYGLKKKQVCFRNIQISSPKIFINAYHYLPCPEMANKRTPSANYSVKI